MAQRAVTGRAEADPRRADLIVPFVPPKVRADDAPFDYWNLAGMLCGVVSLIMRYKYFGWAAVFCCVVAAATAKASESEARQNSSTVMLALMSLVINYLPIQRPSF